MQKKKSRYELAQYLSTELHIIKIPAMQSTVTEERHSRTSQARSEHEANVLASCWSVAWLVLGP